MYQIKLLKIIQNKWKKIENLGWKQNDSKKFVNKK